MNQVVRFDNTKRKLNWEQEEQMRSGKKRGEKRRQDRISKSNNKWGEQDDE